MLREISLDAQDELKWNPLWAKSVWPRVNENGRNSGEFALYVALQNFVILVTTAKN